MNDQANVPQATDEEVAELRAWACHWRGRVPYLVTKLLSRLEAVERERDAAVLEQRRADTFLISCPWCFTKMEQNASRAIKHLICCGDRVQEEIRHSRDRLREALQTILTTHCAYPDLPTPYQIGVTDGHRCAANMAREALKEG